MRAFTKSPSRTWSERMDRAPSATSPGASGARPLTIVGITTPDVYCTPMTSMRVPEMSNWVTVATETAATSGSALSTGAKTADKSGRAGAPSFTSQFHP